ELELGRRLMDFVHHERVVRQDVAILEPATRDSRGDNDDVPRGCVRRGLALTIDDADLELRSAQDDFCNGTDGERLPRASAGDDAEPLERRGELADLGAMHALE